MSSNYTSYNIVYSLSRPQRPPKPLEQMSDAEVAAAVVERLKFPFLCKSCGRRVKEVDSGGVCSSCTGWWSWSTAIYTSTATHYTFASATSSWNVSFSTRGRAP